MLNNLPLVGTTRDLNGHDSLEHWRSIFGGIWGPVELTQIGVGKVSGNLRSRFVGELTFNRITFGNQLFECVKGDATYRDEPFYSLTFPFDGAAECFVGDTHMRLVPNHAYLINVNHTAKLLVEKQYSTFNIQIPLSRLEHRLGRQVTITPRDVIQTDPIFHITRTLISALVDSADRMDNKTAGFLTTQMLDTVAFFLAGGHDSMSDDSVAVQSIRARVHSFLNANFSDPALSPQTIARACGISRSYLYKIFAGGPSVMEHLKRCRLLSARKMIEHCNDKQTLTTIAMACGFTSSSEFSRLFKKEFGIRPSESASANASD